MKKQKICIIGGSLTGLSTAISLAKLNVDIDLITGSNKQKFKSNRTIAISENNYQFLKKLNIVKSLKKVSWASTVMKLYAEVKNNNFSEIFEINSAKNNNIIHTNVINNSFIFIINIKYLHLTLFKKKYFI